MATLREIASKINDPDLLAMCESALLIEAEKIKDATIADPPTSTASERLWARFVLAEPKKEAQKALRLLLAANKDASLAQIEAVATNDDDSTVETLVTSIVPYLVMARDDLPT